VGHWPQPGEEFLPNTAATCVDVEAVVIY